MTAPLMGNTGVNLDDQEATRPHVAGFIVHELARIRSNWRSDADLDTYLKRSEVVGIAGIDTRALTRRLRTRGAQRGVISTRRADAAELVEQLTTLANQMVGGRDANGDSGVGARRGGTWVPAAPGVRSDLVRDSLDFLGFLPARREHRQGAEVSRDQSADRR